MLSSPPPPIDHPFHLPSPSPFSLPFRRFHDLFVLISEVSFTLISSIRLQHKLLFWRWCCLGIACALISFFEFSVIWFDDCGSEELQFHLLRSQKPSYETGI